MSKEAQIALRAQKVAAILELLSQASLTGAELARLVKVERNTLNGYLRYMHKTRREIKPASETRDRSTVWMLGPDPSLPTLDEEIDRIFAAKRGVSKAVQIGIPRDPLIAALFGPAHHQ